MYTEQRKHFTMDARTDGRMYVYMGGQEHEIRNTMLYPYLAADEQLHGLNRDFRRHTF